MLDSEVVELLECFLFEDVDNNQNPDEDNWDISWLGNNFVLRDRETGKIHNIKVQFVEGDLYEEEIAEIAKDQSWYDEDEEYSL